MLHFLASLKEKRLTILAIGVSFVGVVGLGKEGSASSIHESYVGQRDGELNTHTHTHSFPHVSYAEN